MRAVDKLFSTDVQPVDLAAKSDILKQMKENYEKELAEERERTWLQAQKLANRNRQVSIFNETKKKTGEHALFQSSTVSRSVYTSFSGADAKVSIAFKGGKPIAIGEAQTVTYSLFRPMNPVYNLGSAKPVGFVRGPRTIAGSIIFTVFDRHVLISALHNAYSQYDADCLDKTMLADELPPFDIQLTFLNEYGQSAFLAIHDVRITSEGQVMSIEDMITENTMQYMASDITVMKPDVA